MIRVALAGTVAVLVGAAGLLAAPPPVQMAGAVLTVLGQSILAYHAAVLGVWVLGWRWSR